MSKPTRFWIVFVTISIVSLFTNLYLPSVNTPLDIDFTCTKEHALKIAADYATKSNIGPSTYYHIATFSSDEKSQYFIELEGGGIKSLNEMISKNSYNNYFWKIMHVSNDKSSYVTFYISASGSLTGFENNTTPNISTNSIEEVTKTLNNLSFEMSKYQLLPKDIFLHEQNAGTIDNLNFFKLENTDYNGGFVYLEVETNASAIKSCIKKFYIPPSFNDSFSKRDDTKGILTILSVLAMYAINFVIIIVILVVIVTKKKKLQYKAATLFALITSIIEISYTINQSSEYRYLIHESLFSPSVTEFFANFHIVPSLINLNSLFIVLLFLLLIYNFISAFILLLIGEYLTRSAFPNKLQFFRTWSRNTFCSKWNFKITLSSYLIIPIFMLYAAIFYYITINFFGWWSPELQWFLIKPSSYFPWLDSFGISVMAGVFEEISFRAIPLSFAIILDRRFKSKYLFLSLMIIVQLILFGAAHLSYPGLPEYSRLIELIVPSLFFAFVFYRYGLYMSILVHFLYDMALLTLEIHSRPDVQIWHSIISAVIFFFPILFILLMKLISKKWGIIDDDLNSSITKVT